MELTLKNGYTVSVVLNADGQMKSVAMDLKQIGKTGYMFIQFYANGTATEICACPSEHFISIKNYDKDTLVESVFKDTLHMKTFIAHAAEGKSALRTDSHRGGPSHPITRPLMTECPVDLYGHLEIEPQLLVRGKPYMLNLGRGLSHAHTMAAA